MGRHSTTITVVVPKPSESPSRKRKREQYPVAEIEVDVSAPEPPSRKALRKAKKLKPTSIATDPESSTKPVAADENVEIKDSAAPDSSVKRSEFGIWIGNLPWSATKSDVRAFLTKDTAIEDDMITRLHMPPPSRHALANSRQKIKPHNQGFAYVDFSKKDTLEEALALSEKLLTGRRLLIKDSKSFEGRPDAEKVENVAAPSGKPASNRIFVGNLGFDATREDVEKHFASCGQVTNVHVATFEDTGKCKGYAWVEFAELAASAAAIRGWVDFEQKEKFENGEVQSSEDLADIEAPKKKPAPRKWWVNRLSGRPLRMEYAEGKDIRYKKRFGKEGTANRQEQPQGSGNGPISPSIEEDITAATDAIRKPSTKPLRKVDARNIKPGAALAAAPRLTGGIIESQGKKTVFA